jgi:hypothetical protein
MTRSEWLDQIVPLISRTAGLAGQAQNHPAYRAACARVDRLIEHGLEHGFINEREAVTL